MSKIDTIGMNIRQQLASLLDECAMQQASMRTDEVQGLIWALVSGPDEWTITEWLPEILAGVVIGEEEIQQLEQAIAQLQSTLKSQLSKGMIPELWLYTDASGQFDWRSWCNAYLHALEHTPTDWFAREDETFEDLCYPLMALAGVYDATEDEAAIIVIDAQEKQQLQALLPQTLLKIYQYWQVIKHTPATIRHQGTKIGRNKPCPCNSGKKYKACCYQQSKH